MGGGRVYGNVLRSVVVFIVVVCRLVGRVD